MRRLSRANGSRHNSRSSSYSGTHTAHFSETWSTFILTTATLNLIVLRTPDVDATVAFYRALGLSFVAEQHGRGPRHWAAQVGGVVLEIYPLNDGQAADHSTRLGFTVGNLDETLSALKATGVTIASEPKSTSWGLRAVVQDPDGRSVELLQRPGEG